VARRVDFLTDYQDEAYARRYLALVDEARAAERRVRAAAGGASGASGAGRASEPEAGAEEAGTALADAVARGFFKLMAYKDEYEVARLYTQGDFAERLAAQFEGDFTLRVHLAPPLFARRDARGLPVKRAYGPWVFAAFRLLARMRRLRGGAFDVFGRTEERRGERRMIDEYEATMRELFAGLDAERLPIAIEFAALPESIRGYGHVKAGAAAAAARRREDLLARWRTREGVAAQA